MDQQVREAEDRYLAEQDARLIDWGEVYAETGLDPDAPPAPGVDFDSIPAPVFDPDNDRNLFCVINRSLY